MAQLVERVLGKDEVGGSNPPSSSKRTPNRCSFSINAEFRLRTGVAMDFSEKLQELRKQKSLTQEELAQKLYVSRTAVSKWESGRGYPNLDSLKDIAKFFSITIDELLSGNEILKIAENDIKRKQNSLLDLFFGLIDISALLLLFLPFFAEKINDAIYEVSLLRLKNISAYLIITYYTILFLMIVTGIVTLILQNRTIAFWIRIKRKISLLFNAIAMILFIVSLQPYPAVLMILFISIKVFMLIKRH